MAYIPSECSLEEYENVIYSGDAKHRLYVKHGETIIGTNGDNNASPFASSLILKRRILKNGSKTITLNNFISQEIDLVLHDYKIEDLSEEVEIKIGTFIDSVNDYVYIPLGKFLIQDNPTTDKDKTTYKLRDFSVKFDFYYNGKTLIDANGGSATKMQILQDICEQAGVVCKINSFTGYNEKIGIYDNSVTARTYIAYLAEQAGKMASINRYGELVFVDITSDDKTATGEKSIIINDALEKRMNSFIIQGNTQQEKRSGYNLFDLYKFKGVGSSSTIKGVVFTVQDDGGIKVQGTASGDADYYITGWWGSTTVRDTYKAGTYSLKPIAENATMNGAFYAISESTVKIGQNFNSKATVNFAVDTDITAYMLRIFAGETVDTVVYPMIYSGDADKPYEMYGKQPSPDYPSEIETVKGIENLFDGNIEEGQYNTSTGSQITSSSNVRNVNPIFIEPNTEYIFSNNGIGIGMNVCEYDVEGNFLKYTLVSSGNSFVSTETTSYINFFRSNSSVDKIMFEIGTTIHPYVPYGRYLINKITGKNKFNKNTITIGDIVGANPTIRLCSRQSIWLKAGTYTFSCNLIGNLRYCLEVQNVGMVPLKDYPTYIFNTSWIPSTEKTHTFTTTKDGYFDVFLSREGNATLTLDDVMGFDYMLESGSVATEIEPYKEKIITYDLKKENLFDKNNANIIQSYVADWTTVIQGADHTRSIYIPIVGGETYSVLKSIGNFFRVTTTVDIPVAGGSRTNSYIQDDTASHIIINTSSESKYLMVSYYDGDGDLTEEELLNSIRIYKGIQYDDYYELASVNNIKDEIDLVKGILIKRIGKTILNGDLTWKHSSGWTNASAFFSEKPNIWKPKSISGYTKKSNMKSSHLEVVTPATIADTSINGIGHGAGTNIYISIRGITTASDLQTWLSENPITLYYELVEPEIIQLQPTEISTFEGVNNITLIDNIDTTINVNYEGQKHIHNISPDIVEKFTVGDTYKVSKVLFEAGVNKFEDGTDDNDTLYLNPDNPYINQQTQINNIYPNVKGFEINSFKTGKILGNPAVDPADLIKIEYNDIIYKTLAQYTLNFGGTMTSTYETTVEHEAKQSNVNNNGTAQLKKFVKAELDNIDAKFSVEVGEINDGLSDLETNVTNTANRVSNTESKLNDTNTNLENLIGRTTKLEQDNQSWTFEFNNIYEDLTALNNKTNETDKTTKEIKDYIKFVDGNIILEGTDSKCSVVISKEKISFYTDGNESAFISNNELYITDNTVLNKQTIGKWEIKPDSEGNLNTRWIG